MAKITGNASILWDVLNEIYRLDVIGFNEKDNGFRCYIREGENKGNSEYDFIEVINEKVDLLNSTMINITKEVKDKIESLDFTEGNIGMYFDENEKLRVSKEMHEKLFGK